MHRQNEELLMLKKPKTFTEWTMQNGVSINQNSKPKTTTTVGAIHESPAKATQTPKRDAFLEGFYSVEDKPETERRTYLQHRETPSQPRTRSTAPPSSQAKTVEPSVRKPEPIKLPYRPTFTGQPKVTKLPYVPSSDGKPKMTQYGKQMENPSYNFRYINNQNLLSDMSKKEEKDEFLEGFNKDREEENKWKSMLDAVKRGVRIYEGQDEDVSPRVKMARDVFKAYNTSGPLSRAKEKFENSMNDLQAFKEYLDGDYSGTDLLAEVLGWDDSQKDNFVSALNRNNEEDVHERKINDIEAITQVVGGVADKVYPYLEERMLGGNLSPVYILHEKLEDALKAAHYSRNYFNESAPESIDEAKAMGWNDMDANYFHMFGVPNRGKIVKYMPLAGGGEQIFDTSTGENKEVVVTDPKNKATYNVFNYSKNPKLHGVFDVAPWFLWGNSPDDTTTMLERGVLPFVYEAYEEKKKHT